MRKSSQSVPSNIAEGFHRHARRAYRNHVAIACGSTAELQTQLELSKRLNLISSELVARLQALTDEVARLVFGLWKSLSPVVCYPVTLLVVIFGLRPLAFGLFHGFAQLS